MTYNASYPDFELLLPVGHLEMALAAIHNGADAIYVGAPGWNARGRTVDLPWEELQQMIETCHLFGVKVNVALNILIFQAELAELVQHLEKLLSLKPDALIVQDLGVVRLIREMAPEQTVHASTQMTVSNHEAIAFLDDLNIQRFVLARENSLSEIKKIKSATAKDLEVFVHGALCVSYSGQCFTSEGLGGRSANRGQCAQSCRFQYQLIVDGEVLSKAQVPEDYLVSPQDLCGLNEIPELMDIGVKSFKIEGRLKSPEYVGEATRRYREKIEAKLQKVDLSYRQQMIALQDLASTYSRGFYSGWLHGVNHQQLVQGKFASHQGQRLGVIRRIEADFLEIEVVDKIAELEAGDGLHWVLTLDGETKRLGAKIYRAQKLSGQIWRLEFSDQLTLQREWLGVEVFLNSKNSVHNRHRKLLTDRHSQRKIDLEIVVDLSLGKPIRASFFDGRNLVTRTSDSALARALTKATSDAQIEQEITALGGSVFVAKKLTIQRSGAEDHNLFVPQKEIKCLRQLLTQDLIDLRSKSRISGSSVLVRSTEQVQSWLDSSSQLLSQTSKNATRTGLTLLLRNKMQVIELCGAVAGRGLDPSQISAVILDFEFGRDYSQSLQLLKEKNFYAGIATTRILKPDEYLHLRQIQNLRPDVVLVRNLGAMQFLQQQGIDFQTELRGDFSLNVSNLLTAEYLWGRGFSKLCLSYDLNQQQVADVLRAAQARGELSSALEVNIHQYMPSFHMEHCVFAAFLSEGSSYRDCGKPCEKHRVQLRDQFGHLHEIKPDQECRNTMYNAVATSALRYIRSWQELGLRNFRYEALHETGEELLQKVEGYLDFLAGIKSEQELRQALNLVETYGVQEGSFARAHEFADRKKTLSSNSESNLTRNLTLNAKPSKLNPYV